jgi:hypothetical protein
VCDVHGTDPCECHTRKCGACTHAVPACLPVCARCMVDAGSSLNLQTSPTANGGRGGGVLTGRGCNSLILGLGQLAAPNANTATHAPTAPIMINNVLAPPVNAVSRSEPLIFGGGGGSSSGVNSKKSQVNHFYTVCFLDLLCHAVLVMVKTTYEPNR